MIDETVSLIDTLYGKKNSNQILDFTKEIKNADKSFKIKIKYHLF